MSNLQKAGGVAALIAAFAYVTGFALFIAFLDSSAHVGPVRKLAFLIANQSLFQLGIIVTYIFSGLALVVLAIALEERLDDGSPTLGRIAAAFGLIWAGLIVASGMVAIVGLEAVANLYPTDAQGAASAWFAITIVQNGLGGGIEIVGGLWVLLISLAALRSRCFPRMLNYLGLLIGVAGILTVIPALHDLVNVFGLAQIVWFGFLALFMLRNTSGDPAIAQALPERD